MKDKETLAEAAIQRMTVMIVKTQDLIDNPLAGQGYWRADPEELRKELRNRIKGISIVMKVIKEDPTPLSGDHRARFEGLILATIGSLKDKGDKSDLCGILVGMAKAVNAYNQVSKELSNLRSA